MGPKKIVINLDRQVLIASEGDDVRFEFDCVSGDSTHPTPLGKWHIRRKHEKYTSHKYKVPMNFAMFFTDTGEAIHEGVAAGPLSDLKYLNFFGTGTFIGSHRCVRLASEDADALQNGHPSPYFCRSDRPCSTSRLAVATHVRKRVSVLVSSGVLNENGCRGHKDVP